MKKFTLLLFPLLICGISRAQNNVVDSHPAAQIFAINYQTGQETPVSSDDAILFKDAFFDLARATVQAKEILSASPGRKTAVIKQIDPQKLNGYQITWQSVAFNQVRVLCAFYYNIDQNSLFFYDQRERNWVNVQIETDNLINLDHCRAYCRFNSDSQPPDLSLNGNSQAAPDPSAGSDQQLVSEAADAVLADDNVSANTAPPALPEYEQPPCPVDGYLWQPGYWAYSIRVGDYYWVPGVWVAPPHPGVYWTPCYWGFVGGIYRFHVGYWGPHVGFYGGINYGFGYVGVGFVGGEWRGGGFAYNTAVVRVNTTVVHNTYVNNTVINNNTTIVNNRTSFNGQGGVTAKPTQQERAAMNEQHTRPTNEQVAHQQAAVTNKAQFASANNGRPAVTTMAKVTAPVNGPRNVPASNNPRGNNTVTNAKGNNASTNPGGNAATTAPKDNNATTANGNKPPGNPGGKNLSPKPVDNHVPGGGGQHPRQQQQHPRRVAPPKQPKPNGKQKD